ncbi:hypothetical protein HDU88_002372 [Geranomyces variabilis]|nr:hypothetical protein HDU88_002372 [Geranomyces variabilis]
MPTTGNTNPGNLQTVPKKRDVHNYGSHVGGRASGAGSEESSDATRNSDEGANHTRSKEELPSETPLLQTVDPDESNVETYRGRQGFTSMDKERVAEIGSMGGNMAMDKREQD